MNEEEYKVLLSMIIEEDSIESIWNIVNMTCEFLNVSWLYEGIIYPENFLKFLLDNNKISMVLYKHILYSSDFIYGNNLNEVLDVLYNNLTLQIKESNENKIALNVDMFLNYLVAYYLLYNNDEKTYFLNEYLPALIKSEPNKDFFENIQPFKISLSDVKHIKIYLIIKKEYGYNLPIKNQIINQDKIDNKKVNELNDVIEQINYILEIEDNVDVIKNNLNNVKSQLSGLCLEDLYSFWG